MTVPIPPVATQPQPGRTPLRIAVVQFRPKIGQVDANIARARAMCLKLKPHSIDLLCFPEMAFTGYVFDSAEAISPYLEEPRTGPSSLICQEIAKSLGCYVAGGYPERLSEEELLAEPQPRAAETINASLADGMEISPLYDPSTGHASSSTSTTESQAQTTTWVGANSAIIYGPSGDWVGGYRKTNLFEKDKSWAKPGTGFRSFSLPLPSSTESDSAPTILKMSLGICMDLNPQPPNDWTSAEGPYELADHCIENQSRLLVLLNAWLYSGDNDGDTSAASSDTEDQVTKIEEHEGEKEEDEQDAEADEADWSTLRYWVARLQPLWKRDNRRRGSNETVMSGSSAGSDGDNVEPEGEVVEQAVEEEEEEERPPHETIVVVCNRTGEERGTTFAGSSAIFSMRSGSGRPKLLDMMGKNEEGIRVWNLLV